MRVELIEWVDSRAVQPEWFALADLPAEPIHVLYSVGFVADENKTRVVLTTSHDPYRENACGGMIIPKVAIKKRTVLGE